MKKNFDNVVATGNLLFILFFVDFIENKSFLQPNFDGVTLLNH